MTPGVWSGWWVLAQVDPGRADQIDESVRDILSEPPYLDEPNLLERFLQWLMERGVISGDAAGGVGRVLELLVQVAVVAVVAWIGWLVVRRLRTGTFRRAGDEVVTTTTAPERSAAEWLADARDARAAGDHRDAVRAAYRALVVRLVDLEAVPAAPGATVGAHREAIGRAEVVADLQARGFTDASDVFERVWYAEAEADGADADTVIAAAEAVGVRA